MDIQLFKINLAEIALTEIALAVIALVETRLVETALLETVSELQIWLQPFLGPILVLHQVKNARLHAIWLL